MSKNVYFANLLLIGRQLGLVVSELDSWSIDNRSNFVLSNKLNGNGVKNHARISDCHPILDLWKI